MIGVDTLVWLKIIRLLDTKFSDLMLEILEMSDFFITHSVHTEFLYRYEEHVKLLKYVTILPDLKGVRNVFIQQGFDDADASLLEYAMRFDYVIVTEDHEILLEGLKRGKKIIQLCDLFGKLYQVEIIYKKELQKLSKLLRQWRNITKKKENSLKQLID